ncbi:MAG: response regulator transcription factor [Verrucomicrobiales bacterium]|nr:response regulator transcription factor [Verrucomicrobiales bacterium]
MKILVAEDDPLTREALVACLEGEGFAVSAAENGHEALERWQRESPDLVCLDIMMPGLDGYEVCRRIRATRSRVPVVFLSAKNEEIDIVVGLELGADDFVRKPFGRHELLARIRSALRRSAGTEKTSDPRPRESFVMGPITIYPKELRAERAGETIELTPREVAILKLLHERRGEAVDRDTLLDRCWGMDYFPESRTLDQHIAKLRKKLDEDAGDTGLIETVRGVGYRFRIEK